MLNKESPQVEQLLVISKRVEEELKAKILTSVTEVVEASVTFMDEHILRKSYGLRPPLLLEELDKPGHAAAPLAVEDSVGLGDHIRGGHIATLRANMVHEEIADLDHSRRGDGSPPQPSSPSALGGSDSKKSEIERSTTTVASLSEIATRGDLATDAAYLGKVIMANSLQRRASQSPDLSEDKVSRSQSSSSVASNALTQKRENSRSPQGDRSDPKRRRSASF